MCVFMLQQYEAQLCDPLTLSKTLSGVEEDRLKDETHSDTQLLTGRARVRDAHSMNTHSYRGSVLCSSGVPNTPGWHFSSVIYENDWTAFRQVAANRSPGVITSSPMVTDLS